MSDSQSGLRGDISWRKAGSAAREDHITSAFITQTDQFCLQKRLIVREHPAGNDLILVLAEHLPDFRAA
jgi:hypothetical protein